MLLQYQEQMNTCRDGFNDLANQLAHIIVALAPHSILATYKSEFDKLIVNKSNVIIDQFVLKALPYKSQIMNGDDDFFLQKNYKELGDNGNSDFVGNIFEFKTLWTKLDANNKDNIKLYMKLLCTISDEYFETFLKHRALTKTK